MTMTVADKIVAFLGEDKFRGMTPVEIAIVLNLNPHTVRRTTAELRRSGEITRVDTFYGAPVYSITRPSAQPVAYVPPVIDPVL